MKDKLHQINTIIRTYKARVNSAPTEHELSIKDIYEGIKNKYPRKDEKFLKKKIIKMYQSLFYELFNAPVFFLESDENISLDEESIGDADEDSRKEQKQQ